MTSSQNLKLSTFYAPELEEVTMAAFSVRDYGTYSRNKTLDFRSESA